MTLPLPLERGRILRLEPDGKVLLYDSAWNLLRSLRARPLLLRAGKNEVRLSCSFQGTGSGALEAEFRVTGPPLALPPPQGRK